MNYFEECERLKAELDQVKTAAIEAPKPDGSAVEVYKAKDGFRWRVTARNGRIVAESGEGYSREADCRKAYAKLTLPVLPERCT